MDWLGFVYALVILYGGYTDYERRGSVMSLITSVTFGGLSLYGASLLSVNPKNVKVLFFSSGVLSIIMGERYVTTGKLMPAGVLSVLSLLMVFRLLSIAVM